MSKPALLILDDEKEVLNTLNRVLRKEFELFLFSDALEAIAFYQENPVPLVISDMRMPVMDGAEFLTKIIELNSQSKRFLLTGHADIGMTVSAINEGKITHFFEKPWNNAELISELKIAYKLYITELKSQKILKINIKKNAQLSLINSSLELEINKSQKKLALVSSKEAKSFVRLKKTFTTFIDIYAETISLHTQDYTQHNTRVAAHARLMAEHLNCDKLTVFQIYIAGLVYEAGKLALSQTILSQAIESLAHHERTLFDGFYQKSYEILQKVDELLYVANIVKHIPEHYDGLGKPDHLAGDDIPLGSRILAVVSAFDNFVIGRQVSSSISVIEAKHRIKERSGKFFDPEIVMLYMKLLETMPSPKEGEIEYPISLNLLKVGYVLAQDVINGHQHTLLTKGTIIEQQHIDKLTELQLEEDNFMFFIKSINK